MKQEFIEMTGLLNGAGDLVGALCDTRPEVSVRINPHKTSSRTLFSSLRDGDVPWCPGAFYLSERPVFTLVPELHSGAFYVQDASSMFGSFLLRQILIELGSRPLCYLDACAAPGGKTTAAIDLLPEGSLVVANEYDPSRCGALVENIRRWGSPDVVVTRGDAARLGKCGPMFDVIACDAPCSGEGMMRKEPEAVSQWSRGLVESCAATQREILSGLIGALRPGGFLIYSTCTFNTSENEENVAWLLENFPLEQVAITGIDPSWGILTGENVAGVSPEGCVRFYPSRLRGEGQFMALLRRKGEWKPYDTPPQKKKSKIPAQNIPPAVGNFINVQNPAFRTAEGIITAFPEVWLPQLGKLEKVTKIVLAGLEVGTVKGKDFIPSHALALSTALNPDAWPQVELAEEDALSYLRGNAPQLPPDTPRGIVLLTCHDLPIGFAKNLGNRANSLLPQNARIRNL